ncbi:MAG: MOSC N-terminal beta barrel domain-containing protein [Burkholderiales bacterium]|nr:MOSC N-terminal beta barrel domain-containing protein [Burkholderiales bacterium]
MSDLQVTLARLGLHPVKSCGALAPREALVVETGLEFDRAWMVVDEHGTMLTQRRWPRMALVRPTMRRDDVVLRAPGMLALHLSLDAVEAPTRVRVWDDIVRAYDMGDLAAQWFSDFLGLRCRLARFDPDEKRVSDRAWTGEAEGQAAFADAFALLVISNASLAELNRRLAAGGHAPVGIERFRPNLVLDGLEAFDEDHVDEIVFDADGGPVRIRLVKPCVRCGIPNVDPARGEPGGEPGRTLAAFRADPRMGGGITFGMNAIVLDGVERMLRVGQAGAATLKF